MPATVLRCRHNATGRRAACAAPHGPADQRAPPPDSKSPLGGLSVRESERFTTGHIQPRQLQSQPLSLSYRSLLPTSLTYFGLESRDCSPWGPDADIGTVRRAGRARYAPTLFKGPLDQRYEPELARSQASRKPAQRLTRLRRARDSHNEKRKFSTAAR